MDGEEQLAQLLQDGGLACPGSRLQTLSAPQLMQRRAYNAWSPAQRYFVEGDHVVQAEIGRTMQFTGLDGGKCTGSEASTQDARRVWAAGAGSFYPFVLYTVLATVIASAFMVIPFVVAPARVDLEKSSAYECGFDAFGEVRRLLCSRCWVASSQSALCH